MAPQNSGIFFIGDDEPQSFINSHLTSTHGNSPNSVPGSGPNGGNNNLSMVSRDMQNHVMMNSSSSPMLFSSNNITIPGSSVADGSNGVQRQDPTCVQLHGSNATSQTQIPLSRARRAWESLLHVPNNLTQAQKKTRLSMEDDDLTQLILSQRLPRQALLQQQQAELLHQQLQMKLQKELQLYKVWQQQQQQQQIRGSRLSEDSVCVRRLLKYLYDQRHKPSNSSQYWRKFVTEFFSPGAKKIWCLSHPINPGDSTPGLGLGPFAPAAAKCNLCHSKSICEATFDSLPMLQESKFANGILDELFTLNTPSERRYDSGITVLEYEKVVKETVCEHFRVVREGHLRIIFSPELKILSWEFCTRRAQKLLNQVNQVAEKRQSTINQSGSDGISQQDLQANSNSVMAAGSQLAKGVESRALHGLDFSKRYVPGLQTSEIVSSTKDMMHLSHDPKVGPIEALKSYPYPKMAGNSGMQEMEQLVNASRGLPPDRNNSLNKHLALRHSGANIAMNNQGSFPASAQAAASVLANYQTMLMEQNHPKSDPNNTTIQQETSKNNQSASQGYQGTGPLMPGFVQIPSITGVSSQLSPQQQMPSSIYSGSTQQYYQQPSSGRSGNQTLEQNLLYVPAAETNIAMNNMNGQGSLPASAQAAASAQATASVLYQTMLMEQNHPKSDPNNTTIQQEPSTRNQSAFPSYQDTGPLIPGFVQTPATSGVSSHLSPQQQMPSSIYNGAIPQYHQQPPSGGSGNQTLEQNPLYVLAAETNIAMNNMNGQGSLPASAQAAASAQATASVLVNYQTMLMEQNHPKSDPNNTTIQQEPSIRNQSASPSYQGTGPLMPGFVQTPTISGVSSHLSPQQQMPSSIYNGSTQQYCQQPYSGRSGNQTLEQNPLYVPAAETPSTSDKGTTNGLDQSQNLEDVGSDTSLDFEIDIDKLMEFLSEN